MEGPGPGAPVPAQGPRASPSPPRSVRARAWGLSLSVPTRASAAVSVSACLPAGAPLCVCVCVCVSRVCGRLSVTCLRRGPLLPSPPRVTRGRSGSEVPAGGSAGQETDSSRPLPAPGPCPRTALRRGVPWGPAPPAGPGAKGQPAPRAGAPLAGSLRTPQAAPHGRGLYGTY